MAKCELCNQDMINSNGCNKKYYQFSDGSILPAIQYGKDHRIKRLPSRCGDCACKKSNYHHLNCDMEICPKCKNQLTSCDCEPKIQVKLGAQD